MSRTLRVADFYRQSGIYTWEASVPELAKTAPLILNSPQNVSISPGNLPAGAFQEVVSRLRGR